MVNMMPRFRHFPRRLRRLVLALACLAAPPTTAARVVAQAAAQAPGPGSFERCRAMTEDAARLRCYESATSKPAPKTSPQTPASDTGSWRLVRTHNPKGGQDAVSIMQTADITKSDLDLAGLMLRCSEGGPEVLVVLLTPLPPRARPKVTLTAAGQRTDFTATIVPPGALLLLPKDASELASGPWRTGTTLSVQIDTTQGEPALIQGLIPLSGLGGALPVLLANCPSP